MVHAEAPPPGPEAAEPIPRELVEALPEAAAPIRTVGAYVFSNSELERILF